jgi:hypothetical protein
LPADALAEDNFELPLDLALAADADRLLALGSTIASPDDFPAARSLGLVDLLDLSPLLSEAQMDALYWHRYTSVTCDAPAEPPRLYTVSSGHWAAALAELLLQNAVRAGDVDALVDTAGWAVRLGPLATGLALGAPVPPAAAIGDTSTVDDSMLEIIAVLCPNLERLDLSTCEFVTEDGLLNSGILELPRLHTVVLTGTELAAPDVIELLQQVGDIDFVC